MTSQIMKIVIFLGVIFILAFALFSLIFDLFVYPETATTITIPTSTSTTTSIVSTTTTSTTTTQTTTTTATTTATSTSTTITELILKGVETVEYSGYGLNLNNIVSTSGGDKYLISIKTPDGATDEVEFYDKFVIDNLEFGILERYGGLSVKIYVRDYDIATSRAPKHSKIITLGGKNFFLFERTFIDYKFKLHGRKLHIQKPNGDTDSYDMPDNGSIVVDDLEIGALQYSYPSGYTAIYIKSSYDFEFSNYLKSGTYNNIHKTFGISSEGIDLLENPAHYMQERDGPFVYSVDVGYIPMQDIYENETLVDLEWRGKILFAGEEFYVMDIEDDTIYLVKGTIRGINNLRFSSSYSGYEFKAKGLSYNPEGDISNMSLLIQDPDDQESCIVLYPNQISIIDEYIRIQPITAYKERGVIRADIFIYDLFPLAVLQNGQSIPHKPQWIIKFGTVEQPFGEDMNVEEYENITKGQRLLANITIIRRERV